MHILSIQVYKLLNKVVKEVRGCVMRIFLQLFNLFSYVDKIENRKKLQNCKKSQEIILNCDGIDKNAGRSSKFLII